MVTFNEIPERDEREGHMDNRRQFKEDTVKANALRTLFGIARKHQRGWYSEHWMNTGEIIRRYDQRDTRSR